MSRFPTTRWTLIIAADSPDSVEARRALSFLCETYWHPLYVFARGKGYGVEDARDLIQGFFARFLGRANIRSVDRAKGRFRSYLLTALKHYASDERARQAAQKRGGGMEIASLDLDFDAGERAYQVLAARDQEPDRLYDRKWALQLLDRVVLRLRESYEERGQPDRYEALIPYVTGDQGEGSYGRVAERLGLNEGAVRVAVHRLRKQYFAALEAEVADTVADESEIEGELRHLLRSLRG